MIKKALPYVIGALVGLVVTELAGDHVKKAVAKLKGGA